MLKFLKDLLKRLFYVCKHEKMRLEYYQMDQENANVPMFVCVQCNEKIKKYSSDGTRYNPDFIAAMKQYRRNDQYVQKLHQLRPR